MLDRLDFLAWLPFTNADVLIYQMLIHSITVQKVGVLENLQFDHVLMSDTSIFGSRLLAVEATNRVLVHAHLVFLPESLADGSATNLVVRADSLGAFLVFFELERHVRSHAFGFESCFILFFV